MTIQDRKRSGSAAGFTLLEVLVVAGIIAIMTALSLPAIARFIRNYRIRGAVQEIAGEMQRARGTAIGKNVNLGVVFLATSPTTYRYVVEDPQTAGPIVRPVIDSAFLDDPLNADRVFPEHTLPPRVEFATSAAECPASALAPVGLAFVPNNFSVRFTRLGAACNPTGAAEPCPEVAPPRSPVMMNGAAGAVVCVRELTTGLSRTLLLLPSGQLVDQR